jgi:peptidoglycan/xylan/chitin deacetylase (PgdA/CDA1 family)
MKIIASNVATLTLPITLTSCRFPPQKSIKHIITLSFDDGFKQSSIRTAEIFEKYHLSACMNVIASAHYDTFKFPNEYHKWPVGDFGLWNELKARGHEIMPHGYDHSNLSQLELSKAKDKIMRCFDVFSKELNGFDSKESVFNFPYNASTPELEGWLVEQVKAFRTGGNPINPLPYNNQKKLTCTSYGPENIDNHLKQQIGKLFSQPSGWLIYNTHGLDDEGWGPLTSKCLDEILERLTKIKTVAILPVGKALSTIG